MKKGLGLLSLMVIGSSIVGCSLSKDDSKDYLSGTTLPSDEVGSDGEYYLNTTNKDLYYKKDGKWVLVTNIDVNHKEEKEYLEGEGEPASTLGEDGKYYLDITNKDLYYKKNGKWEYVSNIDMSDRLKEGSYKYSKDGVVVEVTIDDKETITNLVVTGKDGYTPTYKIENHLIVLTLTKNHEVITKTLGLKDTTLVEGKYVLIDKYDEETSNKLLKTFKGKDSEDSSLKVEFTIVDETNATLVYKGNNGVTYQGTYEISQIEGNIYTIVFSKDTPIFVIELDISKVEDAIVAHEL